MTRRWFGAPLFTSLIVALLLLSACGGDSDDAGSTDGGDGTATGTGGLQLSSTDLGDLLVDGGGNTLYLFLPDDQGASTCYNDCEAAWPVVGELSTVGEGLDAALLGTTERNNGDLQATYNGWPLHYFSADAGPGETRGQGANNVWYVVDADGNPVGAG